MSREDRITHLIPAEPGWEAVFPSDSGRPPCPIVGWFIDAASETGVLAVEDYGNGTSVSLLNSEVLLEIRRGVWS